MLKSILFRLRLMMVLCSAVAIQCVHAKPKRDDSKVNQVAWKVNGAWKTYQTEGASHAGYKVPMPSSSVNFYIGVPKDMSGKDKYLYVHTRRKANQPLSLYRNKTRYYHWFVYDASHQLASKNVSGKDFISYHRNSASFSSPKSSPLKSWHAPYSGILSAPTYVMVQEALRDLGDDYGPSAERLLRVKGERPLMSWIRVNTRRPALGETLFVSFAYNGQSLPPQYIKFVRE